MRHRNGRNGRNGGPPRDKNLKIHGKNARKCVFKIMFSDGNGIQGSEGRES